MAPACSPLKGQAPASSTTKATFHNQSTSVSRRRLSLSRQTSVCQSTLGGSHKYVDAIDSVLLVHGRTGHVRVGPWICLRNEYGCVYLANLITRVTRWFPPKLWIWRTSPGRPSSTSTCLPTGRRLGVHCALPGLSTCATIKADPPRQPNDGRRRCTVPELHWSAALARFVRQRPTFPIKGHYERANGTQWKKI